MHGLYRSVVIEFNEFNDQKEIVESAPQVGEEVVSSSVQGAYVKTLEESEKLLLERTATEQLARQLSRGLRIRRSADQRVIRSPSARKIGAIRRRSRESPRVNDSVIISKKYFILLLRFISHAVVSQ